MLFELLADPNQHDKIFDAILVSSSNDGHSMLDMKLVLTGRQGRLL
jgi:hypothetical protein